MVVTFLVAFMCASAKVLRAGQRALVMDDPLIGSAHSINGLGTPLPAIPFTSHSLSSHAPISAGGTLSHNYNGITSSPSPPLLLLQEGQYTDDDDEEAPRVQGQQEDRKEEQGNTPLVYSLHEGGKGDEEEDAPIKDREKDEREERKARDKGNDTTPLVYSLRKERGKGEEGKETDLIITDALEANVYKGSGVEGKTTNTSSIITPVGRNNDEAGLGDGEEYRVGADLGTQDASGGTESDFRSSYPFPFTPSSHEEDKSKHHHKSKKEQREGEGKEAWWATLFSVTVLIVSVTVILGKIMEVFRLIIWV